MRSGSSSGQTRNWLRTPDWQPIFEASRDACIVRPRFLRQIRLAQLGPLVAEVRSLVTEPQANGQTLVTPRVAVAAYLKLVEFDVYLSRRSFSALYERVRKYPLDS